MLLRTPVGHVPLGALSVGREPAPCPAGPSPGAIDTASSRARVSIAGGHVAAYAAAFTRARWVFSSIIELSSASNGVPRAWAGACIRPGLNM